MGQVFSTEEELTLAKETIGSLLYNVMLEGGAVPELRVVHPLLLTNHSKGAESQDRLQEQLQQVKMIYYLFTYYDDYYFSLIHLL